MTDPVPVRRRVDRPAGPDQRAGVWVYAVVGGTPGPLNGLIGVGGAAVRALSPGCAVAVLTAFASTVDLAEFGEEALRRNLEDLDWLAAVARAHHDVIGSLAASGPLVPMRLATVFSSDARVEAMLGERAADLSDTLERVRSGREWGVKVYEAPSAQAAPPSGRPGTAAEPGAGAAYLNRRRRQLAAQQDARRSARGSAGAVHRELARLARATRLHPPQAPQLSGAAAPMIVNGAYLVDEDRAGLFADTVRALAGRFPGVRIELTGPWPPYSFAMSVAGAEREQRD